MRNMGTILRPWYARAKTWLSALAGLLICLFLVNLFAASRSPNPVEAASAWCVEQGWPKEDLQLLRWEETSWSGLNRQGHVDFAVKGTKPPRTIRVRVRKPHSFVDWRVTGAEDVPVSDASQKRR